MPIVVQHLSDKELSVVEELETGFVGNYVKYAKRLTDAPELFHIGCAFGVLSGAVGKLAYDPLLHSYPNLWILLLGPTTIYRKTTSLRIARNILLELDQDLMVATDFSPQAFIQEFADRGDKPGVLFRDETSGLFRSMSRSEYMAGTKELLIKLFDGDSFVRSLRSERIQVDSPYFVWMGGAVTSKMMESLTDEDVFSGLMVRFILLNPESPGEYKPLKYESVAEDWIRTALLDRLIGIRRELSKSTTIMVGSTLTHKSQGKVFVLTPQGLDRWNRYVKETETAAVGDPITEKVTSRAGPLVLKLMMLLAADRLELTTRSLGTVIVPYEILLEAIYFGEIFRQQSVNTLSGVGRTKTERTMERVMELVRKRPGVTRSRVMNSLGLSSSTMTEFKRTLVERDLIKIGISGQDECYFPGGEA